MDLCRTEWTCQCNLESHATTIPTVRTTGTLPAPKERKVMMSPIPTSQCNPRANGNSKCNWIKSHRKIFCNRFKVLKRMLREKHFQKHKITMFRRKIWRPLSRMWRTLPRSIRSRCLPVRSRFSKVFMNPNEARRYRRKRRSNECRSGWTSSSCDRRMSSISKTSTHSRRSMDLILAILRKWTKASKKTINQRSWSGIRRVSITVTSSGRTSTLPNN